MGVRILHHFTMALDMCRVSIIHCNDSIGYDVPTRHNAKSQSSISGVAMNLTGISVTAGTSLSE